MSETPHLRPVPLGPDDPTPADRVGAPYNLPLLALVAELASLATDHARVLRAMAAEIRGLAEPASGQVVAAIAFACEAYHQQASETAQELKRAAGG